MTRFSRTLHTKPLSTRSPAPVAAAAGAGLLFLMLATDALASPGAYLALTGEKQGVLRGGSTVEAHKYDYEVLNLSVTDLVSPSEIRMTVPLAGLPQLFSALTAHEALSATVSVVGSGADAKPGATVATVKAKTAFVTALSLSARKGAYYSVDVTLALSSPVTITDAKGTIAGFPTVPATKLPDSVSGANLRGEIRAGTEKYAVQPAAVSWTVSQSGASGAARASKTVLGNLTFTKAADKNSAGLSQMIEKKTKLDQATFTWMGIDDMRGAPITVFELKLEAARLVKATPSSDPSAPEQYTVQLGVPEFDGRVVTLTQKTPAVQASY